MGGNHHIRRWPLRRFAVVEDSMRPSLHPGDGLLGLRGGRARRGQVRVFPDPTLPTRWLVKRVGDVRGVGHQTSFQATSDNPDAPGVVDSRQFGWVSAAGSYRVVWTVSGRADERRAEMAAGNVRVKVVLLAVVSSCVLAVAYRILSGSTHSRVGRHVRAPIGGGDGYRSPWGH